VGKPNEAKYLFKDNLVLWQRCYAWISGPDREVIDGQVLRSVD
jgi:hypothetical protein